jgi:hypothetical protein
MKRPNVTTAKIVKLYKKHGSPSKVASIVKRHVTVVRKRLIAAGALDTKW